LITATDVQITVIDLDWSGEQIGAETIRPEGPFMK
jgi:hypothetical protein